MIAFARTTPRRINFVLEYFLVKYPATNEAKTKPTT